MKKRIFQIPLVESFQKYGHLSSQLEELSKVKLCSYRAGVVLSEYNFTINFCHVVFEKLDYPAICVSSF